LSRAFGPAVAALLLAGSACCCYVPTVAKSPRVSRGERPRRELAGPKPGARDQQPLVRVRLTAAAFPAELACNRTTTLSCGRESRRVEPGTAVTLRLDRGIAVGVGGQAWQRTGDTVRFQPAEEGLFTVGGRRYRGAMLAFRDSTGALALVNELALEDYLASVVPCEIGPINEATFEAVKAQAVAARSFTLTRLERRKGLGHALFDTYRRDQEYRGAGAEVELARQAVRATAGEVLLWQGAPLEALYHANCGGKTAPGAGPPLQPVFDTPDRRPGRAWCAGGKHSNWTTEMSRDEFERKLATVAGKGDRVRVRSVRVERDGSGRAHKLDFTSDKGSFRVGGSEFRMGLGLKSTLFELELGARKVKFTGRGWGHGVGLCQEGAVAMARSGADYRRILNHYYTGVTVGRQY
jgi:stage II sporulation protein D